MMLAGFLVIKQLQTSYCCLTLLAYYCYYCIGVQPSSIQCAANKAGANVGGKQRSHYKEEACTSTSPAYGSVYTTLSQTRLLSILPNRVCSVGITNSTRYSTRY